MAAGAGHVAIGRVVQAHGVRGEVAVFPLTEREERLAAGETVHLSGSATGEAPLTPFRVTASRPHRGRILLTLEGITSRTEAERLVGSYIVIPAAEAEAERAEDEFFLHALVGREIRNEKGERLGVIADVVETGGHPLLEIEIEVGGGRRLLPFVREFVREIGDSALVIAPPEGWEEL